MQKFRKYVPIAGTVACALAIGVLMQAGREVPPSQPPHLSPVAIEATPLSTPAPAAASAASPSELAEGPAPETVGESPEVTKTETVRLDQVTLTAAAPLPRLPRALPEGESLQPARLDEFGDVPADPEVPQLGCPLTATATPRQNAMVRISLAAPCYPNERVIVHHSGMMFTDSTDDTGTLDIEVPALTEHAIFILAFANGKGAVAQADVPEISEFDRVVLQWSGNGGFQLHAREFGAGYGEPGHVWAGNPESASGGFVTTLGQADTLAPQLAQVYSFPAARAQRTGSVALSIETEVTGANCGRDVSAQILNVAADHRLKTRDLNLSVPDCDAVGDFLVLNNLVDDLKIAGK